MCHKAMSVQLPHELDSDRVFGLLVVVYRRHMNEFGGWKCVDKWLVQVIWSAPWLCSTDNALVLASTNAL